MMHKHFPQENVLGRGDERNSHCTGFGIIGGSDAVAVNTWKPLSVCHGRGGITSNGHFTVSSAMELQSNMQNNYVEINVTVMAGMGRGGERSYTWEHSR
jgi:hypothetical protein